MGALCTGGVLLPWLGFTQDGMPWLMSREPRGAPRIEFVVSHKPSGTLFLTDHFLPPTAGKPLKPNTIGFKMVDAEAAKASVLRVKELDIQRAVFSHGTRAACLLETQAAKVLNESYDGLLLAHTASPCEPCTAQEETIDVRVAVEAAGMSRK